MQLHAFTITLQLPDWVSADDAEALVAAATAGAVVEICQAATDKDKLEAGYQVEVELETRQ